MTIAESATPRSEEASVSAVARIVHVVDSLDAGGMENGIVNVASRLAARGYDFHVICLNRRGRFAERMPIPEQVVSLGKQPGFSAGFANTVRLELERLGPGIVHTHNLGPLIYAGITGYGGRFGSLVHGEHAELDTSERAWRRLLLRKLLYTRCQAVHAVSESLKRDILAVGLRHRRLIAIPNGVDTERFRPAACRATLRRELGLPQPSEGFVIGMVGRFGAYKRQELLVQAFDLVAARHAKAWLTLVGDGGPRAAAVRDRVAASPYRDRIVLAGFQAEPSPWYRAIDLMVLPSLNEGLSNAVLESMASGTPVLAHSSCGCAEIIEDGQTGFLSDFQDPAGLAEMLSRFLDSPDGNWRSVGDAARRLVERRFSLEAMADGYQSFYEETLRRGTVSIA